MINFILLEKKWGWLAATTDDTEPIYIYIFATYHTECCIDCPYN